jgi:hypothetical protein
MAIGSMPSIRLSAKADHRSKMASIFSICQHAFGRMMEY